VKASPRSRGFTLTELLVTLAIIAVLFAIVVPTVARVRRAQQSAACLATLRQIGEAFSLYAHDNQMRLPDPGVANLSWEQMLARYHTAPYACPADSELFPTLGSSYDWRDTGNQSTTLAGRAVADITRPSAALAFEALPGWHGRRKINVARLDGAVAAQDEADFFRELAAPVKEPSSRARP
jgi:prepilin-type N-terminal cleavage/methylation domain-containing protein